MSGKARVCGWIVVFGVLPAATAMAGEKVDNPEYQQWAKFKPGTYAALKSVSDTMGQKSETTMIQTLKQVSADKLVVEMKVIAMAAGQKMEMPAQTREIPAKIDKKELDEQEGQQEDIKTTEGEEEIEIAGKKFKAKWVETEMKQDGGLIKTKSWMSEDFPGQVLKSRTTMEGAYAVTTDSIVTDFKIVK